MAGHRTLRVMLLGLAATFAAPAAAQEPRPTAEWFAGVWSDHDDCRNPVRFQADGRFVVIANGAEGRWRIEDGTMVLSAQNVPDQRMPMERLDRNRARSTQNGVISYRCEGPNNTRSR